MLRTSQATDLFRQILSSSVMADISVDQTRGDISVPMDSAAESAMTTTVTITDWLLEDFRAEPVALAKLRMVVTDKAGVAPAPPNP